MKLDDDVMKRIDDALGSVVIRDPKLTAENTPKSASSDPHVCPTMGCRLTGTSRGQSTPGKRGFTASMVNRQWRQRCTSAA